jgi:hypothetical protein
MPAVAFLNYPNTPVEKKGAIRFYVLAFITPTSSGDRKYCNDYSPDRKTDI